MSTTKTTWKRWGASTKSWLSGRALGTKTSRAALVLLAALSVGAYLAAQYGTPDTESELYLQMVTAAFSMERATAVIRDCRLARGVELSPDDVNRTGLIGIQYSPLTTTLGDLAAKRTTTNPNMAALLVRLLYEAGAERGDAIAIGASGSFPALIVATLAAAQAMGLHPILICSLGASQWGANDPRFTWLEMEDCLVTGGVFPEAYRAVAVSLGGDHDAALELDPEVRDALVAAIAARNVRFLYEPDLARNVAERVRTYDAHAGGRRIAAFVGIGGNWADMGEDPAVLSLQPGLNVLPSVPEGPATGVAFEMARRGIPVVHLLNIRGLVTRYGLPWDPSPLPSPGEGYLYVEGPYSSRLLFHLTAAVYMGLLVCTAAVSLWWDRRKEASG
ncbi:MAG: poly-gamma-glutamate system protein [Candidatus Bipolaricaulis sp.]|nr:poly-gamma-glutamate system protein [Candidatus Bipolaricaulis sp.]